MFDFSNKLPEHYSIKNGKRMGEDVGYRFHVQIIQLCCNFCVSTYKIINGAGTELAKVYLWKA